jgi:hypothetical protein
VRGWLGLLQWLPLDKMFQNKKLFYYFLISLISGVTIYFLQFFKVKLPNFINFYANDFFIIPIILFICLQLLKFTRKQTNLTIPLFYILYLCALYSVIFEFILPNYLARYTKDYIDIMLYFASGILFYTLQK